MVISLTTVKIMNKKLRKSLWGLQWIFLKNEKKVFRSSVRRTSELAVHEDSVASDIEDFPDISMRKLEEFEVPSIKVDKVSTKEKYKMSHIEDLPNLSYKNPHIQLDVLDTHWAEHERIQFERRLESEKHSRPKTVEIRRVVFPPKTMIRHKKPELNTPVNRRKNYGKWFLPPNKWEHSLNQNLQKAK